MLAASAAPYPDAMPEGDTIHRTAAALRPVLVDRALTRVELPRVRRPHLEVGRVVTAVEPRGKHLLIHTDDGRVLHTHLRMTGAWHTYRPRERWRKPPRAARVVLGVEGAVVVCFSAPIVEVLDAAGLPRHPTLRALGPDLCDASVDLEEAVRRMGALAAADTPIGEVMLDQRIACGVGNVYRCDVLFLHGLDPSTPLGAVGEVTRRALLTDAARLLRRNLGPGPRTTAPGAGPGGLWVHGRGGAPCRRCGTAITISHLGEQARVVYRCPTCQPDHTGAGDAGAGDTGVGATARN